MNKRHFRTDVGWVERSEPHRDRAHSGWWGSLRSTHPTRVAYVYLRWPIALTAFVAALACAGVAGAQVPFSHHGEAVPRDVREIYERGLQYLVGAQNQDGSWRGGNSGPGTTGMALMVLLASGEDPNYGLYRENVRRALRYIIKSQNAETGYLQSSMYHHGFGMLGLAEAYGTVDDRDLWPPGQEKDGRSIGKALELAVRATITSQKKNSTGAWRYSPDSTDADTSVSGAVLVGLLAARNAGIEVPDTCIDKAVSYYKSMTSNEGQVGYSGVGGFGESIARTSIATLVYAVARRQDLPQYKATLSYLTNRLEELPQQYPEYSYYYEAQALFQGDVEAWKKWNARLIQHLKKSQQSDGSFRGQLGTEVDTSLTLLALALNYRLLPIYER
jgi:hypothetical protein